MEIMSFKKKRGNIYEIELNTGDRYKIFDDVILKYELLINRKIDSVLLEKVLKDNALLEAYYTALKYLKVKMRTEDEIEKYLKKKEYHESDIYYAIQKLKSEGAIDNRRYAEAYINDAMLFTLDGPKKMRVDLGKLGIGDNLIDPVLNGIDSSVWEERITKFVEKRAKINHDSEKMFKNKVCQALSMSGYSMEQIRRVVEDYKLDTSLAFCKNADKIYNKLATKFSGKELELRFRAKMYSKGFDSDKISEYLSLK